MPQLSVKLSNGSTHTVTVDSLDVLVTQLKGILSPIISIEAEFQRVVFKGKVLNDNDKLSAVGIEDGSCVHVVKSQAKSSVAPVAPQVAPTQTQVVNTSENVAQPTQHQQNPYAALFGAPPPGSAPPMQNWGASGFGGSWAPDPAQAMEMMQNPQIMQMVQMMMQNPQMMQAMMASNPMLQNMPPEVLQQSLQVMNNPAMMQQMAQMMRGQQQGGGHQQQNQQSPFFIPPPAGNPREIYASQLEQLRTMGFPNEQANIAALQQSQGNIEFAIERLLNA